MYTQMKIISRVNTALEKIAVIKQSEITKFNTTKRKETVAATKTVM